MRLVHSVKKSALPTVLKEGLKAAHGYSCVGLEMRRGVVFCWLKREDDRLKSDDRVCVEVTVEKERCVVADMDLISLAMMYEPGSGSDSPAIPVRKNAEAAKLLAEVYRITAVPLAEYQEGMFGSPEVVVAGDIGPECLCLQRELERPVDWPAECPAPDLLRREVAEMAEAVVAVLRGRFPESLRGLYFKGSAQKPWDSLLDYVPEVSDVDFHLLFHDMVAVNRALTEMGSALAIQKEIEAEYRRRVPQPIHTPRPQFVILNQLLEDPRYSPTPEAVVETLWGEPYPEAQWEEERERALARERLREQAETPAWLRMRVLDKPGVYLLTVLRDLNWRVSPIAPRVLLLKGLPFADVWSWNRTRLVEELLAVGELELAENYRAFYVNGWRCFLSRFGDSEALREAVLAGTRALETSVAIAQQ